MEEMKPPEIVPKLSSSLAQFEIVFAEDPKNPLSLISPPLNDIEEMAELGRTSFSLKKDGVHQDLLRVTAEDRLFEMLEKSKRFQDSATFNNRLANLHGLVGNEREEESSAELAYRLQSTPLFARKVGEVRARRGDIAGAREIFSRIWAADSYSALRLASFGVIEGDLELAEKWVEEALRLNPAGYSERLFQGALRLIQNDFGPAIAFFRMALDERPNSSVAYSNLGMAYLGANSPLKAFRCLKRSISLDPFNRNALVALADVGSRLRRHAEVVSALQYFVEFEQKDPVVWGRLARSLLRMNLIDESIQALKCQGGIKSTAGVWNNLGVAYAKKKDFKNALQALNHALHMDAEGGLTQELLIARNIASLVASVGMFEQALAITTSIVEQDIDRSIARDRKVAEIYSIHMHAMLRVGRSKEALQVAESLLEVENLAESLTKWIILTETSHHGIERDDDNKLGTLLDQFKLRLKDPSERNTRVLNNMAFAFAELGRLDEAMYCINLASAVVHKEPYITATLGLIHLKKGNLSRGVSLYREAIHLSQRDADKARIRQKMNIELGKMFEIEDVGKSKRYFLRAFGEKRGERALHKQAAALLRRLPKH